MVGYAYHFRRSDTDEFIIVPKIDNFSAIPRWIADEIGTAAPFHELHLGPAGGLPGINERDLKTEIETYGYAVIQAHFELRGAIN
jgi:hypothetical protein